MWYRNVHTNSAYCIPVVIIVMCFDRIITRLYTTHRNRISINRLSVTMTIFLKIIKNMNLSKILYNVIKLSSDDHDSRRRKL